MRNSWLSLVTLVAAALALFGADGPAPAQQSEPESVQAQAAPEQSPITAARNNALALVRPVVDSLWEPIAWPMRHSEVISLAQRLQLTHEQTIAIERLHQVYFEQACAERLQAIESLLTLNPDAMRIPNVIAPADDVKKAVNLRRGWMATLSQLDETLFAQIAEVLGEAQAAKLPREQARRARASFATDAWVAQWFAWDWNPHGYQLPPRPPLYEIADVVDDLGLDAEQRAAIDGMLGDCEAQLTRQVNAVFNAACKARERLAANPHRLFSPEYNAELSRGLAIASEATMRLVLLEAASVDRLAKMLPESAGRALIIRYTRTVAADSIDGIAPPERHFAAALANKDLTAAERRRIDSLQSSARQAAVAALPAAILQNRLRGMEMLRLGGVNHGVQDEDYPAYLQAIRADRKPEEELHRLGRQSFEDIRAIVGGERFGAINVEINRPIEEDRRRRLEAEYAPASNFVGRSTHFSASNALPRSPGASDVQIVLDRLGLDDGAAAIIRTLNDDRAAAWQAILKEADRDIRAALNPDTVEDPSATKAAYAAHHRAIADFAVNEAIFADSLRTALEGLADDAIALLTLCRSWTFMTSAPPQVPSPANSSSLSASVTLHLDRVNAVHVLLGLDLPLNRLTTGIAALNERTSGVRTVSDAYRRAVLDAIEAGDLLNVQGRAQHDFTKMKAAFEAQTNAALEARRIRGDLLQALSETHDAVAAALDDEAAALYQRAVQHIAYPSAVAGIDQAMRRFDAALALHDLSDDQRQRLSAAAAEHRRAMFAAADNISALIDRYVQVEGYTTDAEVKAAAIYARMEHALFIRDEFCAAADSRIRPILSPQQMRVINRPR